MWTHKSKLSPWEISFMLHFLGFLSCISWHRHCAASLQGTGVLFLRSPSPTSQTLTAAFSCTLSSPRPGLTMRIINLARAHASLPSTASALSILYLAAVFFFWAVWPLSPVLQRLIVPPSLCRFKFEDFLNLYISDEKKNISQDYKGTSRGRKESFIIVIVFRKDEGLSSNLAESLTRPFLGPIKTFSSKIKAANSPCEPHITSV